MRKISRMLIGFFRKPIVFNDPIRCKPVSHLFGFDRGTPIDRYYINAFLEQNRDVIGGHVLEIAESTYSKQYGRNVDKYEILHYDHSNRKATIIGDLTKPETLPENRIDCFICTQTLNFIYDVRKAIEGSYKVLKQGGVFLGTVSGISQISRYDMDRWGDYWRFTNLSMQKLMEETYGEGNVQICVFGNALAATAFLQGLAVEDLPNVALLDEKDEDYQLTIGIRATKC